MMAVYAFIGLLSIVLAMMLLRRSQKSTFFETETGADETDITAEEGRQSTTGSNGL